MYTHGPTPGLNIICAETPELPTISNVSGVGVLARLACLDGPGVLMNGDAEAPMAARAVVTVSVDVFMLFLCFCLVLKLEKDVVV